MAEVIIAILTVLIYMTLWFLYGQKKGRNDVADIAWGPGFYVLALVLMLYSESYDLYSILALLMIAVWSVRLAAHISERHAKSSEDKRYVAMKNGWKFKTLQAYTNVFLLQGVFMLLVSAPIILFFSDSTTQLSWYNWVGLLIWIIGFSFEAVGDSQLKKFLLKKSNKGKVMQQGLWQYTRHPNYFGEITLWWGFYIFTLFTEYWFIGIVGPVTITLLILGVSGIPMLEKRYKGNKEYDEYKKRTSSFFPLPSKTN
ncbi:DUF1295 domain-containing protein [Candidatus Saccharibacteria bacterium]|nr:DUF1295 domain-containing protein [Candidatus Saccharibacteria bacterium]